MLLACRNESTLANEYASRTTRFAGYVPATAAPPMVNASRASNKRLDRCDLSFVAEFITENSGAKARARTTRKFRAKKVMGNSPNDCRNDDYLISILEPRAMQLAPAPGSVIVKAIAYLK